ncbi:MAG: L-seryl-tRNA(Sec) selenium transferase [Phycisphaeraceae bacterium]
MALPAQTELLRQLPSIDDLLRTDAVARWLTAHPRPVVVRSLRSAVDELRQQILSGDARCGVQHVGEAYVLERAGRKLEEAVRPRLRSAINATGIILHTGLGRAVLAEPVVDEMDGPMKGYCTLAIDPETGQRRNRDRIVEPLLCELTGAEAATVVNNNAAATMLVLAALAAGREVIVSRGQLIEIGGAFRLPDVMELSGARLAEVGTTNRTHLRDYAGAIGEETAAMMRVHPSNFRVMGFTGEVGLDDLVALGRERGVAVIDDLGAGALVDLSRFGLPHEPTVQASIAAGADVVLFSADKLIGAGQGGILVGKKALIDRCRKHPLARAMRVDKGCLLALERTLGMFRDEKLLCRAHPLYRMLSAGLAELRERAEALVRAIERACGSGAAELRVVEGAGYLGSGSLPMHELATVLVELSSPGVKAGELARRLRTDEAGVFARVERERVLFDLRTVQEREIAAVAEAVGRVLA